MSLLKLREPLELTMYRVLPEDISDFISVYIIHHGDSSCSIVDTGPQVSVSRLTSLVTRLECKVDNLLLTHIHLDHGGGAGGFVKEYGDARVLVHPRGNKHLANPTKLWQASLQALGPVAEFYQEPLPVPETLLHSPGDGERLNLDGIEVIVVHTPGHASHHMSFWLPSEKILFSGDSAGMYLERQGKFVPSTPPPFHFGQYIDSLDKQAKLAPSYIAFPHNTIIEAGDFLKRHRDQIIAWVEAAEEVLEKSNNYSDEEKVNLVTDALKSADDQANALLSDSDTLVRAIMHSSIQGLIDYVVRIKPREEQR